MTDNYGMHFTSAARTQRKSWLQVLNSCFLYIGIPYLNLLERNVYKYKTIFRVYFQTHYSFTCSCAACKLDLPRVENLPDQVQQTSQRKLWTAKANYKKYYKVATAVCPRCRASMTRFGDQWKCEQCSGTRKHAQVQPIPQNQCKHMNKDFI